MHPLEGSVDAGVESDIETSKECNRRVHSKVESSYTSSSSQNGKDESRTLGDETSDNRTIPRSRHLRIVCGLNEHIEGICGGRR